MGRCTQHIHPNRVNAMPPHGFPFSLAMICNLFNWNWFNHRIRFQSAFVTYTKCDERCRAGRLAKRIQRRLRYSFSGNWSHAPNCFPIRSSCPASIDTIASRRCCHPLAVRSAASSWTPANIVDGAIVNSFRALLTVSDSPEAGEDSRQTKTNWFKIEMSKQQPTSRWNWRWTIQYLIGINDCVGVIDSFEAASIFP